MTDCRGDAPTPPTPGQPDRASHEPDCEESLAVLYDFLDGELPDTTQEQVAAHLERCRGCYPYFNFQRLFLDRLAAAGDSPEPCPELADRIRSLLDAETT